jgi:hypothetical protein
LKKKANPLLHKNLLVSHVTCPAKILPHCLSKYDFTCERSFEPKSKRKERSMSLATAGQESRLTYQFVE